MTKTVVFNPLKQNLFNTTTQRSFTVSVKMSISQAIHLDILKTRMMFFISSNSQISNK